MAQQFEQPSEADTRAQRMTADESSAVIALWQSERVEQTGLTDKPAVPDVAEGLDITVEDVQRLLNEVRVRREEESRLLAQEQVLAEIRLAEEERRLAEIQRQRAELRREQAEATRRQSVPGQAGTWQAEVKPKPLHRAPHLQQNFYEKESVERHSTETQEGLDTPSYLWAAFIFVFVLFVILSNTLK